MPAAPRSDRPFSQREIRLWNNEISINLVLRADARAVLTGTVWTVEGEVPGLELLERKVADRTREGLGERKRGPIDDIDDRRAVTETESCFHRVGKTSLHTLSLHQSIDDDLYRVLLITCQVKIFRQIAGLTVDASPRVAVTHKVGDKTVVFSLASSNDRGKDLKPRVIVEVEHPINDLLRCLS